MQTLTWHPIGLVPLFYQKLHIEQDQKEAETFIPGLVNRLAAPKGSAVLNMGCGRGENSQLLASLGFNVTGTDFSNENIEAAKKLESDQLEFFVHDMRLPLRGNYFNYVFNLFTSFGYFRTRREHEDTMRTIAQSLRPGGIFVIDYINSHYAEEHTAHRTSIEIADTRYSIQGWNDETHFYKKIIVENPALSKPVEYLQENAKLSLGDFTDMLSFQRLQVQEVFGDYQFSPYHLHNSPRLIVLATKPINGPGL